jgi:hypothetical protein
MTPIAKELTFTLAKPAQHTNAHVKMNLQAQTSDVLTTFYNTMQDFSDKLHGTKAVAGISIILHNTTRPPRGIATVPHISISRDTKSITYEGQSVPIDMNIGFKILSVTTIVMNFV